MKKYIVFFVIFLIITIIFEILFYLIQMFFTQGGISFSSDDDLITGVFLFFVKVFIALPIYRKYVSRNESKNNREKIDYSFEITELDLADIEKDRLFKKIGNIQLIAYFDNEGVLNLRWRHLEKEKDIVERCEWYNNDIIGHIGLNDHLKKRVIQLQEIKNWNTILRKKN